MNTSKLVKWITDGFPPKKDVINFLTTGSEWDIIFPFTDKTGMSFYNEESGETVEIIGTEFFDYCETRKIEKWQIAANILFIKFL